MATPVSASILTIDNTKYNVQSAGKAWSITQTDSDTYRFEVRAGDRWSVDPASKNRAEFAMRTDIGNDTAIGVKYKMTIEEGAKNTASFTVLGQFHQSEGNADSGKAAPFSIGLVGERMVVSIAYRDATGKEVFENIFTDKQDVARGHEYSFSINAEFDPDGVGHLTVQRDGVAIVDYTGTLGWTAQSGVYWKEGIYRGAANETLAVSYSGLSVSTGKGASGADPKGPITYDQYDGSGKVVAEVTTQPDGAKSVKAFDDAGKLVKLTETAASGAWSVTTHGITGKSYQSETLSFDKAGKLVSLVGRHTDNSLDYQQIRNADGSQDNWQYDAKGALTKHEVIKTSGARDVYEYGFADKTVESVHRSYDTSGTLRVSEQRYANGKLDHVTKWNADGSKEVTDYNTSGVVISNTLTKADGSRTVSESGITGKSYVSAVTTYDKDGGIVSLERKHADGTLDYSSATNGQGTLVKFFDAKGALTKTELSATNGNREIYEYDGASKTMPSAHRLYDKDGNLSLFETYYANGNKISSQNYDASGSKVLKEFNTSGALVTQSLFKVDGSKQVDIFGVVGKTFTQMSSVYDKDGTVLSLTRLHADGTREYTFSKTAAGTSASFFDDKGTLTKTEAVGVNGARDVYEYGFADKSVASVHRTYDKAGTMTVYETKNADGSLDYVKTWKADGSVSAVDYDAKGTLLSSTVVNADKTSVVGQYNIAGKSFTSTTAAYDKNGDMQSYVRYHADGTRDYAVEKSAGGTTTSFYDNGGDMIKKEVALSGGGRDVFDYKITGQSFVTTERSYDASNKMVLWEGIDAAGNKMVSAFAKGVTLESGSGNDVLASFGGDKLYFKDSFGHDKVQNFQAGSGAGHDTLVIDATGIDDMTDLGLKQVGSDVVVTVGHYGTITLDHVDLASLHTADFVFV